MTLDAITSNLRNRLLEYRQAHKGVLISIHVNTVDIALCLTEFSLKTNPARELTPEEEEWFNGSRHVYDVFVNSEWEDIRILYEDLVLNVRDKNYFRT